MTYLDPRLGRKEVEPGPPTERVLSREGIERAFGNP